MQISQDLHPFEISRRLRLFWAQLVGDLDFRYPDTRRRMALELKLELAKEDQEIFQDLIDQFFQATHLVSALDWSILFHWNERYQQARLLSKVTTATKGTLPIPNTELQKTIVQRLQEIEDQVRGSSLSKTPSIHDLLRFRWKFGALRDEADYLLERLSPS